ncbi:sensor histidine kinase [Schumannella sp. 10F1B-5-1]|uniref:sensor histidine kinase n=1 Tax=Schumannella sp. 10F1B-5-1 TaxID=2590780 RepID=UPI0021074DAA|nr:ATP-binding protein [Schumannella sp. 10F1B-5-1]
MTRERDGLLQRIARIYGLGFAVVALLCLAGGVPLTSLAVAAVPFLVLVVALWRVGASRSPLWVILAVLGGAGVIVALVAAGDVETVPGAIAAATSIAAGATASVALTLTSSPGRIVLLVLSFAAIAGTIAVFAGSLGTTEVFLFRLIGPVLLGWAVTSFVAVWLSAGLPRVSRRIASIGRAHRAERQASETEAQRRQGARLLHDTVLATLTLLAHSGVGVSEDALREQAAGDAKLLRQLRLGQTPAPASAGVYNLTPVEQTELGTTLESVKSRFGRMGLEVTWHGTGQLLLPSHILDAFLLALAECLENVRRHSGVTQAHVTITEDATSVRAMVTDQGVGFDIADVGEAKLGFAESVVARLRDVGGNARLFSAPGAGTTVVLEVPR